jgi:hypothetical protein
MDLDFGQIVSMIATFTAFAGLAVPTVIEFIFEKIYQPTTKVLTSVLTFVIAILSTLAVWGAGVWFDVGFLVGVTNLLHVVLYGLGAGVVANWTWVNIEWVKAIIRLIIGGDNELLYAKRNYFMKKK